MAVGMATGAARSTAMPRLKVLAAPRLLRLGGPFVIAAAIIGLVEPLPSPWPMVIASASLAVATLGAAWFLRRSFIELVIEVGLTPVYRISTAGPGQSRLPEGEPVLLIANHTAYADPFWLGAVLRRRFYPMMTSTFYDLPVISFLMRDVVGAIRVPAVGRRKEAPELMEAARLLEQSKCVLVFPEGTLRKCPEPVMRRFGRGIVKLLAEHPRTWVVPVWIEGAWGSYFSEAGGRPMTGKPMDFWRPIRIGIGEPRRIDPALLENQLKARAALQQAVYDCRGILGLDVPLAPAVFENQADDPA
jgi:1-acyl-sn-glycerol-3-phosphate acyltransferase